MKNVITISLIIMILASLGITFVSWFDLDERLNANTAVDNKVLEVLKSHGLIDEIIYNN